MAKIKMNFKEKVLLLGVYRKLLFSVKIKTDELKDVKEKSQTLRSTSLIKIDKDSKKQHNRIIKNLESVEQYQLYLSNEMKKASESAIKIYDIIHSVEDYNHRNILECRYIRGMTFEDMADHLNYCPDYIQKLHRKIVNDLVLYKEEDEEKEKEIILKI